VVHLLLHLLAQAVTCALVERQMGTPKFLALYFAAGIFGFILGGNFSLTGIPSVGASGAIFGVNAVLLVDLIAHWGIEYQPKRKLFGLVFEFVIGMVIGVFVNGVGKFATR
jgi:membrane associated rhomboid family serine protease